MSFNKKKTIPITDVYTVKVW